MSLNRPLIHKIPIRTRAFKTPPLIILSLSTNPSRTFSTTLPRESSTPEWLRTLELQKLQTVRTSHIPGAPVFDALLSRIRDMHVKAKEEHFDAEVPRLEELEKMVIKAHERRKELEAYLEESIGKVK